jgi:hypothetical protein
MKEKFFYKKAMIQALSKGLKSSVGEEDTKNLIQAIDSPLSPLHDFGCVDLSRAMFFSYKIIYSCFLFLCKLYVNLILFSIVNVYFFGYK